MTPSLLLHTGVRAHLAEPQRKPVYSSHESLPPEPSSPAPTGGGVFLANTRQLPEDQTKQLLERRTEQLIESLTRPLVHSQGKIRLLIAEVESLKRKASFSSQVGERPSVNNDGEDNSTGFKSAQRRKWTASDEALLRRLKLVQSNDIGMLSYQVIAERLKLSVDAVKQHWTIMKNTGRQNGKADDEKARRKRRKARLSH